MNHESAVAASASTRAAGAILIVATIGEIFAMAHHPHPAPADIAALAQEILAIAGLAAWVHGILIGLMLLIAYGLSEFVLLAGATRPLIRAGTIVYAAGVVLMIGAALVSGFVDAGIVRSLGIPPASAGPILQALLMFCGVLNRTCANASAVAMSVGIGCWSIALLRESGLRRLIGGLGCAVALLPVVGLLSGALHLNVFGMSAVVVVQGVWYVAIALLLLRR
jgi:hypothetical protein